MMFLSYLLFVLLGIAALAVHYIANKSRKDGLIGNNPTFLQFQRGYFAAYFPAIFADWLNGPYLYKLYSHYGYQEDQIAVLYVIGFASSVVFGTIAPIAADKFGRKKLCILSTLLYSLSCLFKLFGHFGILAWGRILSGASTTILFSAYETWYAHEHIERHDFPSEWIPVTFSKANLWNGCLAIVAGVLANALAEWMHLGPVSPFVLAIPCLITSGLIMAYSWEENYSKEKINFKRSCAEGFRSIMTEPRIFFMGIIQSLFESSMYIFIFLWTPILSPGNAKVSLGITFSCFMVCILLGSGIFQIAQSRHVSSLTLLPIPITMSLVGYLLCALSTHPYTVDRNVSLVAFLLIEISCGIYFPTLAQLRSKLVPETNQRSVMNWFRVPLNLIACFLLMMLHNRSFQMGNFWLFVACSCLLAVSLLFVLKFVSMVRKSDNFSDLNSAEI